MGSAVFQPGRIFVDRSVADLPATHRILKKFPGIPAETLDNAKALKKPAPMTGAKKNLVLAPMKADPIKEFRAMTASSCRPYFSLDLISNCHLECTYCILQSFLENNPAITIYTNTEEILERLTDQITAIPEESVIGTGKIADSLALDDLTEHTRTLVPFFARQNRVTLELKTKSDRIDNLFGLDHAGRTVVSWSMNPPEIIEREEYKTASFEDRLGAAKRVSEAGYPVGFHFDPIILHDGWKETYQKALERIFTKIPEKGIAWMSVGTLRFPARQARIMEKRFPKNEDILKGLVSTNRTFIHYPDAMREEIQAWMEEKIGGHMPQEKIYRCMDFE